MSSHIGHEQMVRQRETLEAELITSGGENILITQARNAILIQEPLKLLQNLKNGSISAVDVLEAFQAKAIEESKRTNCITAFVLEAKEWAKELDVLRSKGLDEMSERPLFGLPVSVKDNIAMKGYDSTLGLEKFLNKPFNFDAPIVTLFKNFGAVPFVKTNVPQMCMSICCSNSLYGECLNPHDLERSPGGSSGGEGALIGGNGAFFGIGSDVGGSVRTPAHFCGVVGFKPTSRRTPNKGLVSALPGAVGVFGTIGFLGSSCELVALVTKAIYSRDLHSLDSQLAPVAWRDDLFTGQSVDRPLQARKSLRIGVYYDDGMFAATPGTKRAISIAVKTLQKIGYEVCPFEFPDSFAMMKAIVGFIMADGGVYTKEHLKDETLDPCNIFFSKLSTLPAELKGTARPYIEHILGDFSVDMATDISSVSDLWKAMVTRARLIDTFSKKWTEAGVDAILGPVSPMPASRKDTNSAITATASYTAPFNLMDYPAVSVPVTRETEEDQQLLHTSYPSHDFMHRLIKENAVDCVGVPIGVQFTAQPFREEVLCRIMLEFSKALE